MSSNTNIGNTPVNQGYVQLIHTGETGGIDGTLRTLYDGDGTASDLQIASNKVKVSMRFRGREMEHQNLGFDLLKKLTSEVEEYAKVEVAPKFEGRQIMMILVPQVAK